MRVAVVTDSAADLPPAEVARAGLHVVPLVVTFGTESYRDGLDLSPQEFWRIAAGRPPTTAAPSPAAFAQAHRAAVDDGATEIVAVHVSSEVSSVFQQSREAARAAAVPVHVVDSRQVGAGQALVVREALRAAGEGRAANDVADAAAQAAGRVQVLALVESIEFLRRGGRVGMLKAAFSDLLRVRPILTLDDGRPTLVAKPRTRTRAIQEIVRRLEGVPGVASAIVAHAMAPDAETVVEMVRQAVGVPVTVTVMGAATGAHLGPGAVAVAVLTAGPRQQGHR